MGVKSFIAMAILAVAPQMVWAHAHFVASTPAPGAVVERTPDKLTLRVTEGLEPIYSKLVLLDAAGQTVSTGVSSLVPGDDKTLALPIDRQLAPGVYTARWQVLSKDGHKTQGSWSFTVRP
ncbi:hypothetical protein CAL12_10515 [Bordetella genomosp. 8]|uniref:CopC domain-containing protein n=1 Tax=Bordetella genomosp. 8 TaxID=1416806 RepID=A0A1W6YJT1_9BORD|nr:copper homeostasis periplasmic binding protein CopC [Bordetella genomosp. 8]ARP81229.1 hypothetical protein CAL12_10515 [Bordetella genomosp. 8]